MRVFVDSSTIDELRVRLVTWIRVLADPKVALKVGVYASGPFFVSPTCLRAVVVHTFHSCVRVRSGGVGVPQKADNGPTQADDLDGRSIARSGRFALVAGLLARAHLVHPGAAVERVAAEDETSVQVDADAVVEALILHLAVDGEAGVALAELDALEVTLQRLLHHLAQWHVLRGKCTLHN